ncbi:MAG: GntR family transcriptional regulator [Candidatus Rokubacteria bacterium]|nr:GntR family transcriptional regulator [Candidatus Rokubacteria bacterium]
MIQRSRGSVPLYFQIASVLRERIRSGQYPASTPFPTEEALRGEFSVSRGTIRLALEALHRDGLIVRRPGLGTFVHERSDRPRTLRFAGSIEELIAHGTEMDLLITDCMVTAASSTEATELKIPDGRQVMRISGLRLSGGQPVAHVTVSVPETLGVLLRLRKGGTYPPIAALLTEQLGQVIREARQVIDVAIADPTLSTALGVAIGSPLLRIRRTYFAADGSPVEFAVSSYSAEKYQYETTIST